MNTLSVADLVQVIIQRRILDPKQTDKLIRKLQHRHTDSQALGQDLIRRGWVTEAQLIQLYGGPLVELHPGAATGVSYRDYKAKAQWRWLMINMVGLLILVGAGGICALLFFKDRMPWADHTSGHLRALEAQAEADFKPVSDLFDDPSYDAEQLRRHLVAFRGRYAETSLALKASAMLAQLKSPLDELARQSIDPKELYPGLPSNLVGILGERRFRHWGAIKLIAVGNGGHFLATAGEDGVRVWDRRGGQELCFIPVTNVQTLAFVLDNKMVATGTTDGNVTLWQSGDGKKYGSFAGPANKVTAMAVSRDAQMAASALDDGSIKVWELESGKEKGTMKIPKGKVTCMAFNPAGDMLATGDDDGAVTMYRPTGLALVGYREHTDKVLCIAFSMDGQMLASGGDDRDRDVVLWNVNEKKVAGKFEGHEGPVFGVAPDGPAVASAGADGTVRLWDVGRETARFTYKGHAAAARGVVLFNESEALGQVLYSAGDDAAIRTWSARSAVETTLLMGHQGPLTSAAFLDDSSALATGGWDKTIKVWSIPAGVARMTMTGHERIITSLQYSPAMKLLISGSYDGTVRVWNPGAPKDSGTLGGHIGPVMAVALAPDGRHIAVAEAASTFQAGEIRLWDAERRKDLGPLTAHQDVVSSVAFSPDGSKLVSGSWDGSARLWDFPSKKEAGVLKDNAFIDAVAVSPDGRSLAVGYQSKAIKVWEMDSQKERLAMTGLTNIVKALTYSPDGKWLASAQPDGKVVIWNAVSGTKQEEWQFPGAINGLAFSPDSRHLATANGNGTAYILRLQDAPQKRSR